MAGRGRGNPADGPPKRDGRMSQTRTLLLVDDDDDLREALAEQLEQEGDFRVRQAATAAAGLAAAHAERPDLILLDVDLPDGDGRDVCAKLRDGDVACPILMLTGADGRRRRDPRPRLRSRRLRRQAVPLRRAPGPHPRPPAQP